MAPELLVEGVSARCRPRLLLVDGEVDDRLVVFNSGAIEGGLLSPPNKATATITATTAGAAMEGGLLSPPNKATATITATTAGAAMEGGLLCPPNTHLAGVTTEELNAAMEGGLLCPPNPMRAMRLPAGPSPQWRAGCYARRTDPSRLYLSDDL